MMDPPGREEGDSGVNQDHDASEHDPSTQMPPHKSTLDHDIPIRLKALRTSLGLSAAMMDRQSGFAIGTIGRLERGDLRIYASHLYRISTATGIAINYFYAQPDGLTATRRENGTENRNDDDQELEKQRLLLAYLKIKDPTLKRDVFELVETLAAESKSKRR